MRLKSIVAHTVVFAFLATVSALAGAPTVSINDVTMAEGNAGPTSFNFTVSIDLTSGSDVTVTYDTFDGTATVGDGDYDSVSGGTATIPAGDTSTTVTVTVNGDTKFELDQDFTVVLSNPINATIGDGTGLGTIQNDDLQPTISIGDVMQLEGDSGTSTFAFTVSLSNASDEQVTVDFATADGTATQPEDYAMATSTVTFAAGDKEETILVTVNGDTTFEVDETFTVDLSNPTNATILDGSGLGTIQNDDGQPTISIDDVTQAEGDSGPSSFTFTVSLSNASDQQITVDFATADGTATQPGDYAMASGTVTFAAGDTSETVTVTVNGDTTFEGDETFTVGLSNAQNATIFDDSGLGTIQNDDGQPTISIDDVTQAEGDSGPTSFIFTVSLSNASDQQITVDFATADGTATQPEDYAMATGTVTFAAGDTSETITVTVNGDLKFEDDETFTVELTNPTGATILDGSGLGTIQNDDPQPTISIADVTENEGDSGTTPFNFAVTLSNPSEEIITVAFNTADGTAVAPGDYATTAGVLTFVPGDTEETVTVNVVGDMVDEPTETFTVVLSIPINATILDDTGLGTIVNDDDPRVTITDVSALEGNSGTTPFVFTVTLDRVSLEEATIDFFTSGGSANQGEDFVDTSGTLTFAPGETSKTITVEVIGDTVPEGDEAFRVHLHRPSNLIIEDNKGDGTILNDDGPSISINDVTKAEGLSGTVDFVFTVSLSSPSDGQVRVDFTTRDGTATAGVDYIATSGTLVFALGESSKTITVVVNGDVEPESTETFFVDLSGAVRAVIADGTGQGNILDGEGPPNQPPDAVDDTASTCTNTSVNIDVLANDTDPENDTLTITDVGTPSNGTAVIEGDGTITYTPGDGFTGIATFTYTISDGSNGNTDTATVTVTVAQMTPAALVVDGQASTGSDGNGVLEPSEIAPVAPEWTNSCSADPISLTGLASAWTGPGDGAGATYDLDDTTADYGTIAPSATASCQDATGDCYAMGATAATRPAFHWDGSFLETLSNDDTKTWIVHLGNSFTDVTTANGFYAFIETMLHLNVTSGCAINGDRLGYCPTASTTREQMSKFVLISKEGPNYTAPACNPSDPRIFADVPASNGFCPFIEELFRRTVVNGCGVNPPIYCPKGIVTREQMAKFVLKTLDPLFVPPPCVPGSEVFADVPATNGFCPFIEELFNRQVVNGCGVNPPRYCPTDPVTREQMSKFLVLTFDLKLYQP